MPSVHAEKENEGTSLLLKEKGELKRKRFRISSSSWQWMPFAMVTPPWRHSLRRFILI
jgi:hypothetical protein